MSKLNPKTLPIAAFVLMVLALLMLATPLLSKSTGLGAFQAGTGANRPFAFQGTPVPGQNGQGFVFQGTPPGDMTTQGQTNPTFPNATGRTFQGGQGVGLLRLGFLSGVTGTLVYAIALLVSLVAALGMFMMKGWGKTLGIIMAILYGLVALVSIVPTILLSFAFRAGNSLTIVFNIVHLVLAIAVLVLVLIPAKKLTGPIAPVTPPATTA